MCTQAQVQANNKECEVTRGHSFTLYHRSAAGAQDKFSHVLSLSPSLLFSCLPYLLSHCFFFFNYNSSVFFPFDP